MAEHALAIERRKPVAKMTRRELREEVELIVGILGNGHPIGTTFHSRMRTVAVIRECARRMAPDRANTAAAIRSLKSEDVT